MAVLIRWVMRPRFGRRGPVELLLLNAVGDLVAHAVFEEQRPLAAGLGSVALWMALAAAMSYLMSRNNHAGSLLGYFPEPVQIVRDGTADREAMHRLRISMADLESELRKQGVGDLSGVRSVTVEPDGAMAIQQADAVAQELKRLAEAVSALTAEVRALRQGGGSGM